MALAGIIDSILNSAESIADTAEKAADSKFQAITTIVLVLLAILAFLIVFAVNAEYALILVGLVIAAAYLLDIDIGRSRNSSGPRK